jgi:hypothetical protein
MPLYVYACSSKACNPDTDVTGTAEQRKKFDHKSSVADLDKEVRCPDCNEVAERTISSSQTSHTSWRVWRM